MGTLRVAGNPIKISGVPDRKEYRPPPTLDRDREAILRMIEDRSGECVSGNTRPQEEP